MIYNRVCLNELREFEFEYNSNRMETNLHEKTTEKNRKRKH